MKHASFQGVYIFLPIDNDEFPNKLVVCLPKKVTLGRMGPGVCWRFVCSLLRHWHWWFSQGTFWDNVGIFVVFLWKPHGNVDFPTFLEPNAKVFTLGNLARKCNNQPENSFKLSEMYVAHETCLTFSKWLKVYHNQLFGHICPPWSWIRGTFWENPCFGWSSDLLL